MVRGYGVRRLRTIYCSSIPENNFWDQNTQTMLGCPMGALKRHVGDRGTVAIIEHSKVFVVQCPGSILFPGLVESVCFCSAPAIMPIGAADTLAKNILNEEV